MTVKIAYILFHTLFMGFSQQSISRMEQWQQQLAQILMTAPRCPRSEALVLRLADQLQDSSFRF